MSDISQTVLFDAIQKWISSFTNIVVAYSGGRDSAVLLDCLVKSTRNDENFHIHVVHVNHGLQDIAMDWEIHAHEAVEKYKKHKKEVHFHLHRADLKTKMETSVSVENIARKARYDALEKIAKTHGANAIFLGHHLQDQAETFLLQAARGSGIMGLASMPYNVEKNGIRRVRPFLNIDRKYIDDYAMCNHVAYVDDPTNNHDMYLRNAIRLKVMPTLREHAPGIDKGLALAASHCAEALEALSCIAKEDVEKVLDDSNSLNTEIFATWPAWRIKNTIRYWIQQELHYPVNAATTERILQMLQDKKEGIIPLNKHQTITLNKNTLKLLQTPTVYSTPTQDTRIEVLSDVFKYNNATWRWSGPLPSVLIAGPRREGLSFSFGSNRPSRSLKKQYQAAGLASNQRQGVFWYSEEGDLVFAPGLGFNHQFQHQLEMLSSPEPVIWTTVDAPLEPNA